ncbi:MAG: hypothetical protein L0Z50_41565, partial [Verrucomicrobiales bacterium]|nr:hypothetical protein [Verrucomicrobiales bacterium]
MIHSLQRKDGPGTARQTTPADGLPPRTGASLLFCHVCRAWPQSCLIRLLRCAIVGGVLALLRAAGLAQPATSLLYYAVEELENQRVVLRGISDGEGDELSRLNVAPNRRHRLWILEAATLRAGSVTFTSAGAGQTRSIPTFALSDRVTHDADHDGLSDLGEFIVGTDGRNP